MIWNDIKILQKCNILREIRLFQEEEAEEASPKWTLCRRRRKRKRRRIRRSFSKVNTLSNVIFSKPWQSCLNTKHTIKAYQKRIYSNHLKTKTLHLGFPFFSTVTNLEKIFTCVRWEMALWWEHSLFWESAAPRVAVLSEMRIFGAWKDVKLWVVIVGVENLDAQAGLCHSFKIQTFFFNLKTIT